MIETPKDSAILILAAGEASRMGEPKQLLPWGATTLLNDTIQTANSFNCPVFVVLGANATVIKESITEKTTCFINENWQEGMGTSVSYGIEQLLLTKPETKSCLLLLADQPLIDCEFLTKLWDNYENINPKIVATNYGSTSGVPAIFNASYFSELSQLNGEKGAKVVLNKHKEDVYSIDGKDKTIDIDTPESYKNILKNTFN